MHVEFFYDFRPVGQGLFSVGRLTRIEDNNRREQHFTWVHDCGSATLTSTAMTREIEALRNGETRPNLDLLILSHFDEDHISGLLLLLGAFRVRRLVLPYFTPVERTLILLTQRANSPLLSQFLAGPTVFIRAAQGGQETEILFVRKSEGPSPDSITPGTIADNPVDIGGADRVGEVEQANDPDLAYAAKSHSVLMKNGSIPLSVWGHWEFCFYNLPQRSKKLERLWRLLGSDFEDFFTQTRSGKNPEPSIHRMKTIYRKVFGSSAAGRNDISLVTYTGPALAKLSSSEMFSLPILYLSKKNKRPPLGYTLRFHTLALFLMGSDPDCVQSIPSLLYTGDISLNKDRVDEIRRLLTLARWEAIQVLQVPHHGAESSWVAGLAAKFSHQYSVFSSARYHSTYRHPREMVLADLHDTTCVLVNEYTGAVFHGHSQWEITSK